jgi:hypothetical protein
MPVGPRTRHDDFAKSLLSEWLRLLGPVETVRAVRGEERTIDVFVHAMPARNRWRAALGALGRMATGHAGVEAHRNPVTSDELATCAAKGIELRAELLRHARRLKRRRSTVSHVKMWVLTPTLSPRLRERFGLLRMDGWPVGFLASSPGWAVGVVVLHDLPESADTLWLRLLARGSCQERAFRELEALPAAHPLQRSAVTRVVRFYRAAKVNPIPTAEQQEFVMNAQRLVDKWERDLVARGKLEGKLEGLAEGEVRGKAAAVLSVLDARGLVVSTATRKRILSCTDGETLDTWLRRAAMASSSRDLLVKVRA